MQADCALLWAGQALRGASVTVKKTPVFLCDMLPSLCEMYEMKFQGVVLVYLPFACL